MKEIKLYYKKGTESISNMLNDTKLSSIEFELEIDDRENGEQIAEYLRGAESRGELLRHYIKRVKHLNYTLFYFTDGIGNKSYLCVENGESEYGV